MRTMKSFDYAVVRIVPRVEREEFVNAGVVFFSLPERFLGARVALDEARLRALCPGVDLELVERHLTAISRICDGEPDAGPIAALPSRERCHWLVAPRRTIIQVSPVHSGLCPDLPAALDRLFHELVKIEGDTEKR